MELLIHKKLRIIKRVQMTASGKYLERERYDSIFTCTNAAFDANTLSHDISTPGFLRCTAAPHEWTVGMWRLVCANSHIALVRVDPVEQSLRSHPFHGQTTLQQKRDNRTALVSKTILYRADNKTWTQTHRILSRPAMTVQLACTTNIGF